MPQKSCNCNRSRCSYLFLCPQWEMGWSWICEGLPLSIKPAVLQGERESLHCMWKHWSGLYGNIVPASHTQTGPTMEWHSHIGNVFFPLVFFFWLPVYKVNTHCFLSNEMETTRHQRHGWSLLSKIMTREQCRRNDLTGICANRRKFTRMSAASPNQPRTSELTVPIIPRLLCCCWVWWW